MTMLIRKLEPDDKKIVKFEDWSREVTQKVTEKDKGMDQRDVKKRSEQNKKVQSQWRKRKKQRMGKRSQNFCNQ